LKARISKKKEAGAAKIPPCHIQVLGQMSLLGNKRINSILSLAQTGDMDAKVRAESFVKATLKNEILPKHGLEYDDDSDLIWLPPGHFFEPLCRLKNVRAELLDAESALVSKAVKAKEKNKRLIQDAIASGLFPGLIDRIDESGGDLEFFAQKDEDE
jgi:hypothetical protein